MKNIPMIFGSMVFNDSVMKERLDEAVYKSLKRTIERGKHLDLDIANVVASAMKDWAVEKGVTHYTHWFQPMTGVTAEKHDSFITPTGDGGIIMEFSGKELVKGESDASSFPSGGLRATFEARGYTAWDPTSYAFIKDNTLCIPTAFCSYGGEALDMKTPLLRSMDALDRQAMRILKLFGDTETKRVMPTAGPEQEYFLVDLSMYESRPDLIYCGRTLLGARPPKGQELDDHYFGAIKPRVASFMAELDEELWKLGVCAKTKHNEAAPAQHELASIYSTANVAADQNQITMELMKSIAARHGLACILHEKPFEGINGSGKHNNWSLSTDKGVNLLDPGETPAQNARFLLFLTAVIKAVDEHQDLLRIAIASAGNDHRLGANEAPPAIVSMFLGDELIDILQDIELGEHHPQREKQEMQIGVNALPHFPKDSTDRNRTSPFAFTGNKFELRMPGSASSISEPNTVLNTTVADALSQFADALEGSDDFHGDLTRLIRENISAHKRILFNGNNYSADWVKEAERRGLLNLPSTVDALPYSISDKNVALFMRCHVFSRSEVFSRYEILLENYSKIINIEALTLIEMLDREIIPAMLRYQSELISLSALKRSLPLPLSGRVEESRLSRVSELTGDLSDRLESFKLSVEEARSVSGALERARFYQSRICSEMSLLRKTSDSLEALSEPGVWPFPSYGKILYSVK